LQIINTRAFNHLGPRQNSELATSSFARQIATLEHTLGREEKAVIKVGNLEARRDYTDVRDMVKAYWLAVSSGKCQPGEAYNLSSGVDHTMQEVLDILLSMANRSITTEVDPARLRPSDIPVVRGDSSLFRALTGWDPKILLPKSLQDLLNYWRDEVRK
jgi:GDP-4-dehydro-6-deoxy-D-mannose reductase